MVKSRKPWIFTALILLALGIILIAAAFFSVGFHVSGFNTVNYEAELTPLDRPYDKIIIDADECNVLIMTPQTRSAFPEFQDMEITSPCVLSYNAGNDIFTECGYRDRDLYITRCDLRPWYERIGYDFNMQSDQIVLFLDDLHFDALEVTTSSGRIWLLSEAQIKDVRMKSVSGQLVAKDLFCEYLSMTSTSGQIFLSTTISDEMILKTVSGEISISTTHSNQTLHAMTTSGEISAETVSAGTLALESTSGDIDFSNAEAIIAVVFESVSGDIEGTLSSGKRFTVKTTSGDVDIPADVPHAAQCIVTTTSGDIDIKIK